VVLFDAVHLPRARLSLSKRLRSLLLHELRGQDFGSVSQRPRRAQCSVHQWNVRDKSSSGSAIVTRVRR